MMKKELCLSNKPLVFDHSSHSIKDLEEMATEHCAAYLKGIGVKPPSIVIADRNRGGNTGYYIPSKCSVFVNSRDCARPVKVPAFRLWSYPGYKVDRTVSGVLCHEIGHHIWYSLKSIFDTKLFNQMRSVWREVYKHSESGDFVSSYARVNIEEDFAESMRLFLMNPDLMSKAFPLRHQFLVDGCGLPRPHTASFEQVLAHAHPKIITASNNLIQRSYAVNSDLFH